MTTSNVTPDLSWALLKAQAIGIMIAWVTINISTKLVTKYPWVKGIQVYLNDGPSPSQRGANWEMIKINFELIKILFSRTTGSISTELGTKYLWVKGIQICSNEGPRPSQRGGNWKNKNNLRSLNVFFSRTTALISTKPGTAHPWVKGIKIVQMKGHAYLKGEIIVNCKNTLKT